MTERIDLTDRNTILCLVLQGRIPAILDPYEPTIRVAVPNAALPAETAIMTRESIPDRVFYVRQDGSSFATGQIQELTLYDANTMRLLVDDALIQTGRREPSLPWLLHNIVNVIG